MSLRTATFLLVVSASTFLFSQAQAPAPPMQTAREALVEMMTGGEKGLTKHLTVEVRDYLTESNSKGQPVFAFFQGMQQQAGSGLQTFPTGNTLLIINEPAQHKKYEVHVDSDDLSGDQDTLQLSLHSFQDGEEQQDDLGYLSSRITVSMKKQEKVWRLSNVGIGMEFPLGDAEFLKKMFGASKQAKTTGMVAALPEPHTELKLEPPAFNPVRAVMELGFAESAFARQHSDVGFTCSLSELAEFAKDFGMDQQISSGSYMGYKVNLSGCEGKPAGSFQIIAEPLSQGRGEKAVCVDATQNVRVADNGQGSSCLAFGKIDSGDGISGVGLDVHVHPDKPKP
jgi:hypothetical protein